jgi:hypothetical protein
LLVLHILVNFGHRPSERRERRSNVYGLKYSASRLVKRSLVISDFHRPISRNISLLASHRLAPDRFHGRGTCNWWNKQDRSNFWKVYLMHIISWTPVISSVE